MDYETAVNHGYPIIDTADGPTFLLPKDMFLDDLLEAVANGVFGAWEELTTRPEYRDVQVQKYAAGQPRNNHGQFSFSHTSEGRPYELQPSSDIEGWNLQAFYQRNVDEKIGDKYANGEYGPESEILCASNRVETFHDYSEGNNEFYVAQVLAFNALGQPKVPSWSGDDKNLALKNILADPNYPQIPEQWKSQAQQEASWKKSDAGLNADALTIWRNSDEASYNAYARQENDFVKSKLKAMKLEGGQTVGQVMDSMKSDIVSQMGEMARTLDVSVSLNKSKLGHFIDEDHYKTVFEVGKVYGKGSGGQEYMTKRTSVEDAIGVPKGLAAANRPVYGVLGNVGSPYGDSSIILRPEIKTRTTITWGDSIDGDSTGAIWASDYANNTVSDADFWRANGYKIASIVGSADSFRDEFTFREVPNKPMTFMGSGLSKPVVTGYTGFNVNNKWHLGALSGYVEAQIHGGVSVKDVAQVIIPSSSALTGKQKQVLTNNGAIIEVSTEIKDSYEAYH